MFYRIAVVSGLRAFHSLALTLNSPSFSYVNSTFKVGYTEYYWVPPSSGKERILGMEFHDSILMEQPHPELFEALGQRIARGRARLTIL